MALYGFVIFVMAEFTFTSCVESQLSGDLPCRSPRGFLKSWDFVVEKFDKFIEFAHLHCFPSCKCHEARAVAPVSICEARCSVSPKSLGSLSNSSGDFQGLPLNV